MLVAAGLKKKPGGLLIRRSLVGHVVPYSSESLDHGIWILWIGSLWVAVTSAILTEKDQGEKDVIALLSPWRFSEKCVHPRQTRQHQAKGMASQWSSEFTGVADGSISGIYLQERGWLKGSCSIKNCTPAWLMAFGKLHPRRLPKDRQQCYPTASSPTIDFSFHNLWEQPCKLLSCPEPLDIVGCLCPKEIAPQQIPIHLLLSFHAS